MYRETVLEDCLLTPSVRAACRAQSIYTRVAWRDEHTPSSGGVGGGTRARDLARSLRSFIRSATARKNAPGHFPNVYNEYALTAA